MISTSLGCSAPSLSLFAMHRIGLLVFFFIFSIQTIARPLAPPLPEVDFAADSNIGYTDEPVGTRSDLEAGPGSLLLASENTGKRKLISQMCWFVGADTRNYCVVPSLTHLAETLRIGKFQVLPVSQTPSTT